jgi:HlyD family secretion protein
VAAAEANLAKARATYSQAKYDKERFTELARYGVVSEREGVQSISTAETQEAVVAASEREVEAARAVLVAAKANLQNPAIRAAQATAIEQQIRQAQFAVASAQADAARIRARLEEATANRKDLEIVAPFDGIVATRSAEPGEVVAAGTAIVTLMNFNEVYLRGFIPEGEIGLVRVGQPARVYLDSNSRQPLEAVVSRIDPQASFTPENTYFRDERVKQVVGVKLQLTNPQGFAKPGMPADGQVLIEGNQWIAKK